MRRFAKLPTESVNLCAQSLGVQTSPEVSSALVDDVSFRIRQVTDTACQFMRHARRKRLTTDDFDKALKWSRVEPLHGHRLGESVRVPLLDEGSLYSLPDQDVDLSSVAMATPVSVGSIPHQSHIEASWLLIEGISPQANRDGETQAFVELKRQLSESSERYMSNLMEALTGDKEDLRRIALTDVQKNNSIANILPEMVLYLQETLSAWLQFTPQQLVYILKLSLALFHNSQLFFDPYVPAVYPSLKAMLLDCSYVKIVEEGEVDHWTVREMAAAAMAQLMLKCESPLNDYLSDLRSSFHHVLNLPDPPLPTMYGTILTLCYLSGESIMELLYPQMDGLAGHLQSLLASKLPTTKKSDILKIYEALLFGAEIILTSGCRLPEQLNSPSSSTTQESTLVVEVQPPLPKETNSLFSNSNFGLSTETADMEIDNVKSGERSSESETKKELTQPSLYDHLVELFGERLLLRLTVSPHFNLCPPLPTKARSSQETHSNFIDKRHPHEISSSLSLFLSQEGFKSSKVKRPITSSLPVRNMFTVHNASLPVTKNVLEQKSRRAKHHKRHERRHQEKHTAEQAISTKPVDKGACASYRRRSSRSGLQSAGVHSVWL